MIDEDLIPVGARVIEVRDVVPGMRLVWGAGQYPTVLTVKTWGPGKDENPSYPNTWWTQVAVGLQTGGTSGRIYSPSCPEFVTDTVPCGTCGVLTSAADLTVKRLANDGVRTRVEQCPACADGEA